MSGPEGKKLRLFVYTPSLVPGDPLFGFSVHWFKELSAHCDSMVISSRFISPAGVPEGAIALELGKPILKRLWRLWRGAWRNRRKYDAVFIHMTDRMVLMGWPVWCLLRKPIYLWYAHGSVTWWLRAAIWLSRKAFTSSEAGLRVETPKRTVIGQGIDTDLFRPGDDGRQLDLITVSRVNPSKRFEDTLEFLADYAKSYPHDAWRFRIIGSSQGYEDYVEKLLDRAKELAIGDRLAIEGPKEYAVLPEVYSSATAFLSNSQTGSIDKVVLESLACGTPVIAAGAGYQKLKGVVDMRDRASAFAALHAWLSGPKTDLAAREEVIKDHSLKRLMAVLAEGMN